MKTVFLFLLLALGTLQTPGQERNPAINVPPSLQDATVTAFVKAAGVTDADAQLRLYKFAAFLKANNRWQWLVDARFYHSSYNPTSQVSLYLKPYTAVNPQYSINGFITSGTNTEYGPLPSVLASNAPHATVFSVRMCSTMGGISNLCHYGDNVQYGAVSQLFGGICDSNTQLGTFVFGGEQPGGGSFPIQFNENALAGTNWGNYPINNAAASYFAHAQMAPAANPFQGDAILGNKILIHNSSNGWHSAYINSFRAGNYNATTNYYVSSAHAWVPFNTFQIASNANWFRNGWVDTNEAQITGAHHYCYGNGQGFEYHLALVFGTNIDDSFAKDITTAALILEPENVVHINCGTSMMNPGAAQFPAGTRPYTNSLGYIWSQRHPNNFMFDLASPGSSIWFSTNLPANLVGSTWLPVTNFISAAINAGKYVEVETDGPRNDYDGSSFDASAPNALGRFDTFYGAMNAAGAHVNYLGTTPLAWSAFATQQTNMWVQAHQVILRPWLNKWSLPIEVVSTNEVTWMSSSGQAHLDNPVTGYPFLVQESESLEIPNFRFTNPTNPALPWVFGGNILPAGDNINLVYLTNNGTATGWKQK